MSKKILIIGVTGSIGTKLRKTLLDKTDYKVIGTNKDTVRFEKNGVIFIKFHANDLIEQLNSCNEIKISIVGKPNINEWMGNRSPQIMIEDYEVIDDLLAF